MKFNFVLQILFLASLFSCSDTSGIDDPMDGEDKTIEVLEPCLNSQNDILLPAPLEDQNQYTMFEQTILIATIVDISESLRVSLPLAFFPPSMVEVVTVDGVTVTSDDKGVEWQVDGERWAYLLKDDGYSIYYFPEGNVAGRMIVDVEQNEDCSSFKYIQYETEPDSDGSRNATAIFNYEKAGTASLYNFGAGLEEDGQQYDLRIFDDKSGDLWIRENGQAVQNMIWDTDGSGSYRIIENEMEVESGTWTF